MAIEQDISLHPANRAAHLYQSGTSQQTRRADQFYVVFNLYPLVNDDFLQPKYNFLKTFRDRLHFLCHTVEGPKFQIQQDVINQYNRKRVINRKVDYDPLSLRMYDTVDGLALKFVKMLYEFEFQNARLYSTTGTGRGRSTDASKDNFQESILTNENQFKKGHNFGMRAQPNHTHRLIKSIDLYQLAGTFWSRAKMIHPRLSRMDMDQFDYSSSAITNISAGFQYENLLFDEVVAQDVTLPSNVSGAFTNTSGKYEDWVRPNDVLAKDKIPPPNDGANSTIGNEYTGEDQGWNIASQGSALNRSAGNYWERTIDEADVQSSDLQKSVTSRFSMESNVDKEKLSYDGGNTSTDTESQAKASTEVLTAAGLTTEMHKAIKNGPSSDTKQSKKEYIDKIRTYEQAIENKKKAEAANKDSIWT
ncbi:MAG: hypothetical protein CMN04_08730 [Roseibacillus sp.]|nr:hypothetical protein [Roseibacillus sp.]